ncbi:homeobox protein 2-like [Sipha flava]|uniref:Homeobox protein 2-like n=1 Tax=Sipha flava TaxID=143950 RepID=A0A2S2QUF2_9HEMI|nr:homeobox protein 2-like [Sipha flava]
MDGVQRNFNMMAEKIDRMRCLRERCENYVRLIKLTLDETIQEQNSILNGSAIHNRLKYLGLMDNSKPSSNTLSFNKMYPKKIDFDNKYKYLVFDDHIDTRKRINKTNLYANDMYSSNNYNDFRPNNKPQIRHYSSADFDTYNSAYYMPISSKKYNKAMNFYTPNCQEYQVYYFPTSKPIAQYPRHTTEQFYKRRPVQQYPEEEVPYWPTRYPKPVKIIEREPSYSMGDYRYRNTINYPVGNTSYEYSPEYRKRYYPTNDNLTYPGYDDYYEADLRQRSFSSITRPCSPVYSRDMLYDKTNLGNSGSLLEKKIRDYVWNPHKERVERYSTPSYEKSTYYSDFKSLQNKRQGDDVFKTRSLNSQVNNPKVELTKEDLYRRNSFLKSPEKRLLNDESFDSQKEDDYLENNSYIKKPETSTNVSKRISFDLDSENIELPNHKYSTEENTYDKPITHERKLLLERKNSIAKHENKRRTSLLSNDNYSASMNKHRALPSDKQVNSRRESLNKPEKLASIGNSFESNKYLNLKNDVQENEPNSLESNVHNNYKDIEKVDYDHNNTYRVLRRNSNNNDRRKVVETSKPPQVDYQDETKNTLNKINNVNINDRRESFKNESVLTNENISSGKVYSNNSDNQLDQEFNNQPDSINESSRTFINQSKIDYTSANKYITNEQETGNPQQFNNNENYLKNNVKTILPYQVDNNSNNDIDIIQSNERDSSELKTIPIEQGPSQDIVNEEFTIDNSHYQEHTIQNLENQPDYTDEHIINEKNYYPDGTTESNKEITTNNNIEPNQHNEFVEENNVHDENNYYYQNPTDDSKENPTQNQYEEPNTQTNYVDEQHADDDYYYQNNYSNVDPKESMLENQYTQPEHQGEYDEHDDYYYQNHAKDDGKEQQVDQQYVDPNYQGNYADQHSAQDDYYYQNYSDANPKGQSQNEYADHGQQAKYVAENVNHDDYYYQNRPEENTSENHADRHYAESELQGNYVDGEQRNYYYEDNSNANTERVPPEQYDEHAQQENYPNDQHANDDYYYQKQDEHYDGTVAKEQYDGYVGDQHETNASYYPDSSTNNYDPQQNYENNSYQTQQSEYVEPYEQNPNNERYGYSDNADESQSMNQLSNEETKQ